MIRFTGTSSAFDKSIGLIGRVHPVRPARSLPDARVSYRSWCSSTQSPPLGGSLVCSILGYGRLICRSGSRGRPGLFGSRGGERSEPERVRNRDGGRTDGRLAVRGRERDAPVPNHHPPASRGLTIPAATFLHFYMATNSGTDHIR